jgi:hypothetical protein
MPMSPGAKLLFLCAVLISATALVGLAGCGSEQAGASVSTPAESAPATSAAESGGAKPQAATKPKPRPGAKTVVLPKAGDRPYDKTFDDIRFEMQVGEKFKRSMLTKEIEALDGQRIRIRGYILPTPQRHGIQQFVLVRDNQECCFGPGAALYDCILVEMKPGNTADFTIRPIAVEGVFNIRVFEVDGKDLAIYQLDAESAK